MPLGKVQFRPLLLLLLYAMGIAAVWLHKHESGNNESGAATKSELICANAVDCGHLSHFQENYESCDLCHLQQKFESISFQQVFNFVKLVHIYPLPEAYYSLVLNTVSGFSVRGPPVI